eukprot:1666591-Alexandrium_andersonii.AAC.1
MAVAETAADTTNILGVLAACVFTPSRVSSAKLALAHALLSMAACAVAKLGQVIAATLHARALM